MRRDKLSDPLPLLEERVDWSQCQLAQRFPRIEEQFCNAAQAKRDHHSRRCRDYKARVRA